jgi:hypothetical protein
MTKRLILLLSIPFLFGNCAHDTPGSESGNRVQEVTPHARANISSSVVGTETSNPIAIHPDHAPLDTSSSANETSEKNEHSLGKLVDMKSPSPAPDTFSDNLNGWELTSDEDGVKTYTKKESENSIIAFRGEKIIQVPIQKIATILNSLEYRKEWVDSKSENRIIDGAHTLNRIEYSRAHVPWPFQDRDFLFRAKVTIGHSPTSMLISMNSVEDSREPPHAGIVRGEIFHSYYFLTDVSDGKTPATRVVLEIAADPKGSIPSWLVNLTQKKWPHRTLLAIDKCASQADLKISPEVTAAFQ